MCAKYLDCERWVVCQTKGYVWILREISLISAYVKDSELQKCGTKPRKELGQKVVTQI